MDDAAADTACSDVSAALAETQAAMSELLKLSGVADVLKEFQRLSLALTGSVAEEKKAAEKNSKTKAELQSLRQVLRAAKVSFVCA